MSKLFSAESFDDDFCIPDDVADLNGMPPCTELLESQEDIGMALEGSQTALARVKALQGIQTMLSGSKIASEGYFATLSCLTSVVGDRQAVMRGMPAMEDYKNTFAAEASHVIAMESVGSFIKKAYDAFKAFFKAFMKKVAVFFKRMLGMDLDLSSYEESLQTLISKLKKNNATNDTPSMVSSKLPSLLGRAGMNEIDSDYILRHGVRKTSLLIDVMKRGGFGDRSPFAKGGMFDQFETVVKQFYLDAERITTASMETHQTVLMNSAASLLFEHFMAKNVDLNSLPESVYDRISDVYDRAQMGDGLSIMAVVDPSDANNTLPNGANMILAHQNSTNFFVCSVTEPVLDISGNVPAIGQLSNLENLYAFYKTAVKSMSGKGADKYLDSVSDRIMKMMDLIVKQSTSFVENEEANPKPKIDEDFVPMFGPDSVATMPDDRRVPIMKELTKYLLDFLQCLQQLINAMVTAFFNTYVRLRLELIKYIYDSARLFSY